MRRVVDTRAFGRKTTATSSRRRRHQDSAANTRVSVFGGGFNELHQRRRRERLRSGSLALRGGFFAEVSKRHREIARDRGQIDAITTDSRSDISVEIQLYHRLNLNNIRSRERNTSPSSQHARRSNRPCSRPCRPLYHKP